MDLVTGVLERDLRVALRVLEHSVFTRLSKCVPKAADVSVCFLSTGCKVLLCFYLRSLIMDFC